MPLQEAYIDYAGRTWLPVTHSPRVVMSPVVIAEYPTTAIKGAGGMDELFRGECSNAEGINITIPVPTDIRLEVRQLVLVLRICKEGRNVEEEQRGGVVRRQ
jgi:hypothetical protein